jgi:DNA-binding MarR family transcriptional regulator
MTDHELRDKEHLILQQVDSGNDDVQKITQETTLENHHVTYAFEKLEELGLVEVSKPEGTVERVIDGQKRVFQHPKQAELTEKGKQYLEHSEQKDLDEYEDLSHGELVERVRKLETEVGELENRIKTFQEQVMRHISD